MMHDRLLRIIIYVHAIVQCLRQTVSRRLPERLLTRHILCFTTIRANVKRGVVAVPCNEHVTQCSSLFLLAFALSHPRLLARKYVGRNCLRVMKKNGAQFDFIMLSMCVKMCAEMEYLPSEINEVEVATMNGSDGISL
jgi:hypothetical protein